MTLVLSPIEIVKRREAEGRLGLLAKAEGWSRVRLGDHCKIVNGAPFPSRQFNRSGRGLPLIRIRDVGQDSSDTYFEGEYEDVHLVNPGDLLIGMDGDFRLARWAGKTALLNQRVCKIVIDSEILHERFVEFVLPGYLEAIWQETSSVTVKHLSSKSVQEIPVPVPSLEEQDEIVRILEEQFSRLEAAAASIAAARRKAEQFRRSLLHAAFTGALTGADSSWPVERLGNVCKVVSGATPKTSVSAHWEGDIPWLTPNDLSKNRSKVVSAGERAITKAGFDSCSTQMVPAGTVLFTSRAPIGYVAIAGAPLCTNQGFKSAIPNDTLFSDFLFWQLQALTEDIRSRASGTTFLEISAKGFSATEVVVPSLEVQRQVVDVIESQIDRYEGIIHAVKTLDNRIVAMRRSLLHAAFNGELTKEWREKNNG